MTSILTSPAGRHSPSSGPSHMANDVVRSSSSLQNYIWIPILISFLLCIFGSVEAQDFLLPSQPHTCPAPNPNLYYWPIIRNSELSPTSMTTPPDFSAMSSPLLTSSLPMWSFVEFGGAQVTLLIFNEPSETLVKVCVSLSSTRRLVYCCFPVVRTWLRSQNKK